MKHWYWLIIMIMFISLSACQRISDPWVTDDEQYAEERARTDAERRVLIDRAQRVQRDR
jgi:cytochrome c biogenesis protein ResB